MPYLPHRDAFDAEAEGPAGVVFGIDAAGCEDVGVDHAAAADFDPAGGVIGRGDQHVDLGGGLGEGEEAGAEADLGCRGRSRLWRTGRWWLRSTMVMPLVDDEGFELVEHGEVGGVDFAISTLKSSAARPWRSSVAAALARQTLKLINRLHTQSTGAIFVDGRSLEEWDVIRLRRMIGYVIQEVGLFPHFTVARNIGVVPQIEGWSSDRIQHRVTELLERMGLEPQLASRYPRELSGGQRQRVGVARALAADPAFLLMDEPFGALDPITRSELQREFLALQQRLGKTVVFVTHDLREALRLGTRIALMESGQL